MAQTLGMATTAEGAETEKQLTLLRASGCQEAKRPRGQEAKRLRDIR
jgi:predicted signal transduction protein with EAL and GGDEF domain